MSSTDPINTHLLARLGVVLSCGVRTRKALFYKVFTGSYFLPGGVKIVILKENGVVKRGVMDMGLRENKRSVQQYQLVNGGIFILY